MRTGERCSWKWGCSCDVFGGQMVCNHPSPCRETILNHWLNVPGNKGIGRANEIIEDICATSEGGEFCVLFNPLEIYTESFQNASTLAVSFALAACTCSG